MIRRRQRRDRSSLAQITDNIHRLARYPHKKNLSSTLFKPHGEQADEMIADIWRIHQDIGYDMNNFNLMFGFASGLNHEKAEKRELLVLDPMTEQEQLGLYKRLHQEFSGTELAYGLKENWFAEFSPNYCTASVNCGEVLPLQADGGQYSCVRGQVMSSIIMVIYLMMA